jgi:hypothetical protein
MTSVTATSTPTLQVEVGYAQSSHFNITLKFINASLVLQVFHRLTVPPKPLSAAFISGPDDIFSPAYTAEGTSFPPVLLLLLLVLFLLVLLRSNPNWNPRQQSPVACLTS